MILSVPVPSVLLTPLAVSIAGRGASSEALAFFGGDVETGYMRFDLFERRHRLLEDWCANWRSGSREHYFCQFA